MFTNYLKTALRIFKRQKLYAVINTLGLAIGLGGCLLIIGFVHHELTFEDCHVNKNRIYRIDGKWSLGEQSVTMASIMAPVGPAIKEICPEIEQQVRLRRLWDVPVDIEGHPTVVPELAFAADPSVFELFTLPLKLGDASTALNEPFSVVISEELADTYFGDATPLGQTIRLADSADVTVTGVMQRIPYNTQVRADMIASYATLSRIGEDVSSWTDIFKDYTYVLLNEGADPSEVQSRIPPLLEKNLGDPAARYHLQLQPLGDIYLHSKLSYELPPPGSIEYIYIFSTVAALLLIIACFNFINLATARTAHRTMEVGVRKTLGAFRRQLVVQFLSESVSLTCLSMLLGLAFYEVARPRLEAFVGRSLELDLISNPFLWLTMVVLVVLVGLLSGSYPAAVLSRFSPSVVLRSGGARGAVHPRLRRILVVLQFAIAVSLLSITMGVDKQIDYLATSDPGFDRDSVILVQLGDELAVERTQTLKAEVLARTSVAVASIIQNAPGENRWILPATRPQNKQVGEEVLMNFMCGDHDFSATFGLDLVQGENLPEQPAEGGPKPALINETAVAEYIEGNPLGFEFYAGDQTYRVVGVVRDFHCHSLHNQILPVLIYHSKNAHRLLAVRLPSTNIAGTAEEIKTVFADVAPEIGFEWSDMYAATEENFTGEEKIRTMFTAFSVLAIFVACLGLFGVVAYVAERRTKEIGIRKVLGATETGIVRLVSREFLILVGVANVVAWPVAYYVLSAWLDDFAYRTSLGLVPFVTAGLAALLITMITVGYQTIKVARANPVEALRYE